eukprot:7080229-Pyramimonas_sp.AAC.2
MQLRVGSSTRGRRGTGRPWRAPPAFGPPPSAAAPLPGGAAGHRSRAASPCAPPSQTRDADGANFSARNKKMPETPESVSYNLRRVMRRASATN